MPIIKIGPKVNLSEILCLFSLSASFMKIISKDSIKNEAAII